MGKAAKLNSVQDSLKLKKLLIALTKRLQALKRPNTVSKLSSKIFKWNTNVSMLLQLRISLTNLAMVADLFTNSTNNAEDWKSKRKNFKLLSKKQKLLLNKKKTRFSELNSSLDKSDKRLIVRSTRRKKSLTILAKTINEPWTHFKHHLKLNLEPRLKL